MKTRSKEYKEEIRKRIIDGGKNKRCVCKAGFVGMNTLIDLYYAKQVYVCERYGVFEQTKIKCFFKNRIAAKNICYKILR